MIKTKEEYYKLLNRLRELNFNNKLSKHLQSKLEAFEEVEDLVKLILPVVMDWVAVKDELPPVELDVLVWDGFSIYITNRLDEDSVVWDESIQILDDVTHWKYLPKPPCA